MSHALSLHPTLGVNPYLSFCPRCGGDGPDIMLIGNRTAVHQCRSCNTMLFGSKSYEPCGKCGASGPHTYLREIEKWDKLPGGLCEKCEKEEKEHLEMVQAGGVYFKCEKCSATGVVKASSELAKHVRSKLNIEPPALCGVTFDSCDQHTPKE